MIWTTIGVMPRWLRIFLAVATALAIATVPIVADWCAVSCEAARTQAAAPPACHHAATSTRHIGQIPAPCSHDHHPVVVDAATIGVTAPRALPAIASAIAQPFVISPLVVRVEAPSHRPHSSSPPLSLALASTLRI